MKLGFTGTREGMTDKQQDQLAEWLASHHVDEWHHGCCWGADAQSVTICYGKLSDRPRIIAHPSDIESMTCRRAVERSDEVREPKPPLDRNHDIVDDSEMLIACPFVPYMQQRSGTWATIRYAWKRKKRVIIFNPGGEVIENQPDPS